MLLPRSDEETRVPKVNEFQKHAITWIVLQHAIRWLQVPVQNGKAMHVLEAHAHVLCPDLDILRGYLGPPLDEIK